jgi:RecA-family ATPase
MLTPHVAGMMLDETSNGPSTGLQDSDAALARLHMRTVDALKGFVKMVKKAEPDFRSVVQRFHDIHVQHADAIGRLLTARGMLVDGDGSFMGKINETVVGLRAFFDEIDEEVMSSVRSGEGHVLKAFDDALKSPLEAHEHQHIASMRADLAQLLHETRHLD